MPSLADFFKAIDIPLKISPIATTASAGDKTILTPSTGKALRISSLYFTATSGTQIILKSGTSAISGAMLLASLAADYPQPISFAPNAPFVINVSSAVSLNGYFIWWEV